MSCQCLCTNTLKFCNQNICGPGIDFDIKAQILGVHKLITYFLNLQIIIEAEFAVDEQIIFPISELNENYEYTVELFDPLGNKIAIRKNDIDYDCFKFRTIIQKVLVAVEVESS